MKITHLLFVITLLNCSNSEQVKTKNTSPQIDKKQSKSITRSNSKKVEISTRSPKELLDSIQSNSSINTTTSFNIQELQTDDFSKMFLLDKQLYNIVFSKQSDYLHNSYFIYSQLPNTKNYYSFITYQKNYEGDYRVDYIDLININENGEQLDKTRLAAVDNEVIIYEVSSTLNGNTLIINEEFSGEPNMDTDIDTIHQSTVTLSLFGHSTLDTMDVKRSYRLIGK